MNSIIIRALVICVVLIQAQALQAQLDSTLKLVPNDANAVAIVRVEKIYGSEMAATEKWIEQSRVKYSSSPLYFPTSTKSVVIAAEIDLGHGSALWEAAYLTMKSEIDMNFVCKLCKGVNHKIAGFESVDTPDGGTMLKLSKNTLATKFPANRQQISRWARSVKNEQTGKLSDYLLKVSEFAQKKSDAEIIMGLDLVDAIGPKQLREKLRQKTWLTDTDTLVKVLSSIQGVTFEVKLRSDATGVMRIDFAEDTSAIKRDAKNLVVAALQDNGLYIRDFDKWETEIQGKQIVFSGRLSSTGLRRVSSIIEPPQASVPTKETTKSDSGEVAGRKARATKEHWDAVQALLKDIRKYQPQTRNQLAFYYERYARKIDGLPILNVDEEELDYASAVANVLRQVALGRRDVVARTAATRKQYRGYDYTYTYGSHGWVRGGRSAQSASEAAAANIIAQGATSKAKLMEGLDQLSASVRRSLTKKFSDYQIEF